MKRSSIALAAVVLLGVTPHGAFARAGKGDKVSLSAMPKPGTALKPGQKVTLSVSASYTLNSAPEGEVMLAVFVPATGQNLVEPQPSKSVARGSGEVALSAAFTVPSGTKRVGLSVILASEPRAVRSPKSQPAAQRIVFYPVR